MGEGVNDTAHVGLLALYIVGHEAEGCSFSCFGSVERTWTFSGLLLPGPPPAPLLPHSPESCMTGGTPSSLLPNLKYPKLLKVLTC